MEIIKNIEVIISGVFGAISIFMALFSMKERKRCETIKNEMNIKIEEMKNQIISSNDKININKITNFDNKKTIN